VTTVKYLGDENELSSLLEDIAAGNSASSIERPVLFVEGKSDIQTLSAWAKTLGMDFEQHNITPLLMDGGRKRSK